MNPTNPHPHKHDPKERGHQQIPAWKRIHHSFIFWIAIVLMLLAMWVYLRSNDLSVRPTGQLQHPVP